MISFLSASTGWCGVCVPVTLATYPKCKCRIHSTGSVPQTTPGSADPSTTHPQPHQTIRPWGHHLRGPERGSIPQRGSGSSVHSQEVERADTDTSPVFIRVPQAIRASRVAQLLKESACNVGDLDSIPGLGRFPGEGKGYPLQYPCLENSMDRGARRSTVHGVAKSWTRWATFTYSNHSAYWIARNAGQRGPGLHRESWSSPWWLQRVSAVSLLLWKEIGNRIPVALVAFASLGFPS